MSLRQPGTLLLWAMSALASIGTAAGGEMPASPQAVFQVRVAGDGVSIDAQDVPLAAVLARIARDAGFQLYLDEQAGASKGSWWFQGLPLEEALSRLVRPYNLLLFFEPGKGQQARPRISALYVLPAPSGADSLSAIDAPPSTEKGEAQHLIDLIKGDGDLTTRRQALADLADLDASTVETAFAAVIGVKEAELRRDVVTSLGRRGSADSLLILGQVALGDPDPGVRLAAVEALAREGGEQARNFLKQALKDKDETVRQGAGRLLGKTGSAH